MGWVIGVKALQRGGGERKKEKVDEEEEENVNEKTDNETNMKRGREQNMNKTTTLRK